MPPAFLIFPPLVIPARTIGCTAKAVQKCMAKFVQLAY
nr:MAG TPA: hypothetical protein [Caudoviricetes sp.]